jgi:FG-GAP-like repeat
MCFAVAVLLPAGGQFATAAHAAAPAATTAPDAHPTPSARPDAPLFRLGDAARPFGGSTAIGDFNTDGTPDVAVANHVARRTTSYAYRLELSISGQPRQDVTFDSDRDAITIHVADVDRDNDLDIIVGTPLSGETVGIWLNDGQGHFTAGDVRQLPSTIQPLQSLDTTDPSVQAAAIEPSPRRGDDVSLVRFGTAFAGSTFQPVLPHTPHAASASASTHTSPRAPPSAPLDVLS